MSRPSTFSIVAYDPVEQAWGVAVASKFPAVGAVVPWAQAHAGAIATQSYANTSYGPNGLKLLASGLSAEETLARLLADDPDREHRQVGIVDAAGRSATFTGKQCSPWAGGLVNENLAIQGNILAGEGVIQAMLDAYQSNAAMHFPDRLITALLAGDRAGGDRRGRQSAAIYVAKHKGGYAGYNDRWIDYRVDDHPDPVSRLVELLELQKLYFGKSPESDQIPLEGEPLASLQRIMIRLGYYQGEPDGRLDAATSDALRVFTGNENFEERVHLDEGRIDRPVYEFLIKRFA